MATLPQDNTRESRDMLTGLADLEERRPLPGWQRGCRHDPVPDPCDDDYARPDRHRQRGLRRKRGRRRAGRSGAAHQAFRRRRARQHDVAGGPDQRREFSCCRVSNAARERWQWLAEALGRCDRQCRLPMGDDTSLRLWPRIALMRATEEDSERHHPRSPVGNGEPHAAGAGAQDRLVERRDRTVGPLVPRSRGRSARRDRQGRDRDTLPAAVCAGWTTG